MCSQATQNLTNAHEQNSVSTDRREATSIQKISLFIWTIKLLSQAISGTQFNTLKGEKCFGQLFKNHTEKFNVCFILMT
jgi:hypothetical protein